MSSVLEKISIRVYIRPMITPEQIRGARAMLGLKQADLAARAGISATGLNNIERGNADPKASTLRSIEDALRQAGIKFIADERGEGVVKLRASAQEGTRPEDLNASNAD